MSTRRDLNLVRAAAVLCALGSALEPLGTARFVFAIPLSLILPGYAIVAAAFGGRRPGRLPMVPLSVGVSLSALVLGSILLNWVPGGIQGISWILLLLLLVLGGCQLAEKRGGSRPIRQRRRQRWKPSVAALLLGGGGVALAVAALVLAQSTLPAKRALGYTELWISPSGSESLARVGVRSEEQHRTSYRLEVRLGRGAKPLIRSITLEPGEISTLDLPVRASLRPLPVEATLSRSGRPRAVYRRVDSWTVPTEGRAG